MNASLRHDLTRDAVLSAARLRRRTRHALLGTTALAPALVVALLLWSRSPEPPLAQAAPTPAPAALPSAPSPAPPAECIESEAELLAELEDLGPMLVTRADGSRWLILTAAAP